MTPLQTLPGELLGSIFSFCNFNDLAQVALVSHALQSACREAIPHISQQQEDATYEVFLRARLLFRHGISERVLMKSVASSMSRQLKSLDLSERPELITSGQIQTSSGKSYKVDSLGESHSATRKRISQIFSAVYSKLETLELPPIQKSAAALRFLLPGMFPPHPMRIIEASVLPKCPSLTSLTIPCSAVDAVFFRFLGKNLIALRSLDLAHKKPFTGIQDESVVFILERLRHLRELDLTGFCEISDVTARAIAQHATQLTFLGISPCKHIYGGRAITDRGVTAIVENCTNLTSLDIAWIRINDAVLESMGNHLLRLRELGMFACTNGCAIQVGHLARGCKDLERLDVGENVVSISQLLELIANCQITEIALDYSTRHYGGSKAADLLEKGVCRINSDYWNLRIPPEPTQSELGN